MRNKEIMSVRHNNIMRLRCAWCGGTKIKVFTDGDAPIAHAICQNRKCAHEWDVIIYDVVNKKNFELSIDQVG